MSGKDLNQLCLETRDERIERHSKNNKPESASSKRNKLSLEKEVSYQRHTQLLSTEKILVGKDLRNSLDQLFSKNGVSEEVKLSTMGEVRTIKLNFQTELAKALQHFLPLHIEFLKRPQYF